MALTQIERGSKRKAISSAESESKQLRQHDWAGKLATPTELMFTMVVKSSPCPAILQMFGGIAVHASVAKSAKGTADVTEKAQFMLIKPFKGLKMALEAKTVLASNTTPTITKLPRAAARPAGPTPIKPTAVTAELVDGRSILIIEPFTKLHWA
ncbi:hypothetical protein C0993_007770 [Termitomyces sp. T159_Od127]|nr:hypothetical protein C0993_007770 [Termitomyces sp. T159_Od127]